jgi:hypothetical protein
MGVLGVLNQSRVIAGPAQVYLVAYPVAGYTGGTDALKVTNLKSLFFSDSATDACRVLIPSAYSELDATGIDLKFKQAPIKFSPNMGGDYKAANGPSELSISWAFKDVDANKIIDAFSAVAGDTFTTVAAAGVAGRKTVMIGRQGVPLKLAMLIRYPSTIISAAGVAEFENIYVPMANMEPTWDVKLDHKNVAVVKITATAVTDMSLLGSQPMPPIALWDQVTAPGT